MSDLLDMQAKCGLTGKGTPHEYLDTFENALFHSSGLVIIDEITKYPPGYVDMLLLLDTKCTHVIVLGDPTQNAWHEPNANCILNDGVVSSEAEHFSTYAGHFGVGTRRLCQKVAGFLGIPTVSNDSRSGFLVRKTPMEGWTRIVPSQRMVDDCITLKAVQAFTSSGSQGRTFPKVNIIINSIVLKNAGYASLWTALTRSRGDVCLVFDFEPTRNNLAYVQAQPLLRELYRLRLLPDRSPVVCPQDWVNMMPNVHAVRHKRVLPNLEWTNMHLIPRERLCLSTSGGRSALPPVDLAAESKAYYSHLREVVAPEPVVVEPEPRFHNAKAHLPRANQESFLEFMRAGVRERFDRELKGSNYFSNQHPDLPQRLPGVNKKFKLSPFGKRDKATFDPIYLNAFHKMKDGDETTFAAAIKKRITLKTPQQNLADFERSSEVSQALYDSLLDLLQLPKDFNVPWDQADFERKIVENEQNRLATKTLSQLNAARPRSQPEWEAHVVNIIMKSEIKAKLESMHGDAKAGQTLAVFADECLFYLGPLCRYLVDRILALCPPNILIYLKCSPRKLDSFVRRFWRDVLSGTNDFTAFDQGQDGAMLGMEMRLLEAFNTPQPMLDYYMWIKTHLRSWLGSFGIMRFTGEFCTFLFNTLGNMAIGNLRFNLRGQVCLFGGDDSAFNFVPIERPDWSYWSSKLTLQFKLEVTDRPAFVSWRLTKHGIFKSPTLLLSRLIFHRSMGSIHRVVLSYFHEFAFAYRLSDILTAYCDERDIEAQSLLTSYFLRRPRLPKQLLYEGSDLDVIEPSDPTGGFCPFAPVHILSVERA